MANHTANGTAKRITSCVTNHTANGAAKRMTNCVTNRTTSDTVNGIKPHGEAHSKRYGELCDEPTRKF